MRNQHTDGATEPTHGGDRNDCVHRIDGTIATWNLDFSIVKRLD